jgi:hypothetical protein
LDRKPNWFGTKAKPISTIRLRTLSPYDFDLLYVAGGRGLRFPRRSYRRAFPAANDLSRIFERIGEPRRPLRFGKKAFSYHAGQTPGLSTISETRVDAIPQVTPEVQYHRSATHPGQDENSSGEKFFLPDLNLHYEPVEPNARFG